jgi:hypothetical protein
MPRRLLLLSLFLHFTVAASLSAELPVALREALESFRTEGPKGWAFTQTTRSPERSRVETFDPRQDFHLKWTLVTENDVPPTTTELETYRQQQTRRSGGATAPNVKEQMDYSTAELISDDGTTATWLLRLKPGGNDDSSAEHMASRLTFHHVFPRIGRQSRTRAHDYHLLPPDGADAFPIAKHRGAGAGTGFLVQVARLRPDRFVFRLSLRWQKIAPFAHDCQHLPVPGH